MSLEETLKGTCEASKAGSWYLDDPDDLSDQLDSFLERVPAAFDGKALPILGARVIIAPHAGYGYSGPCAAWAYKAFDLSRAKRVFILGPTHTYAFRGCALTTFGRYQTPFGDFLVDEKTVTDLYRTQRFSEIPPKADFKEHSLELHMPYLWKRLEQTFPDGSAAFPPIITILAGTLNLEGEQTYGRILAPYVKDPENVFIVSSDFCHWGASQFGYAPHCTPNQIQAFLNDPDAQPSLLPEASGANTENTALVEAYTENGPPEYREKVDVEIHETIKTLDFLALEAMESGSHKLFYHVVEKTGNLVCGRHPIGVMMAALEALKEDGLEEGKGRFKVVQYDRSNIVTDPCDMSVSYVSAFAVL